MQRRTGTVLFCGALIACALVLASAFAASAGAAVWKFNGTELAGSETIAGDAILGSLAIPGLTTTCKEMHYEMAIKNVGGVGRGELEALSFTTCFTSSEECSVGEIGAEKLPWAAHLATVGGSSYLVIEGVEIIIVFAGEACALDETLVTVTGSVAGLFDNTSETFSISSTGWNGVFTTEALGFHREQVLEVG